mgnify:CR=1 FL=1
MNKHQIEMYKGTLQYVLSRYPNQKLNRIFEMSVDMCDFVDWDNEEECGVIFDKDSAIIKRVSKRGGKRKGKMTMYDIKIILDKEDLLETMRNRIDTIKYFYKHLQRVNTSTVEGKKELARISIEDFITLFGATAETIWWEYYD